MRTQAGLALLVSLPLGTLGLRVEDPLPTDVSTASVDDVDVATVVPNDDPDLGSYALVPGAPLDAHRVDLLFSYAAGDARDESEDPDGLHVSGVAGELLAHDDASDLSHRGVDPVTGEHHPVIYYTDGVSERPRSLPVRGGGGLGAGGDLLFIKDTITKVHGLIKSFKGLFGKKNENNAAAHSLADAADCGAGKPALQVAWGWLNKNRNGEETPSRSENNCQPGAGGATTEAQQEMSEVAAEEQVQRAEEEAQAERERAEAEAESAEEGEVDQHATDDLDNAEAEAHGESEVDGATAGGELTEEERAAAEEEAMREDSEHRGGLAGMFGKFLHKDTLAGKALNLASRLTFRKEEEGAGSASREEEERERRLREEEHAREVARETEIAGAHHAGGKSEEEMLAEIREARAQLQDAERSATSLEHRAQAEEERARHELESAHDSSSSVEVKLEKLRLQKEDLAEARRRFEADKESACRALAREKGFDIGGGGSDGTDEDSAMDQVDKVIRETQAEEEARDRDTRIESDREDIEKQRERDAESERESHSDEKSGHGGGVHVRSRKVSDITEEHNAEEESEIKRYRSEAERIAARRKHEEEEWCREDRERRRKLAARALARAHKKAECDKEHPCPTGKWPLVASMVKDGKIVAKFDHFDPRGGDDGASAFDNIRDAAAGHKALRSKHSDAPGGSVCLSLALADLIVKVAEAGTVEINSIAGSSHKWQRVHYDGVAVDFGALDAHRADDPETAQRIAKACSEAGASRVLSAHMKECDSAECARMDKWVHCAVED